MGACFFALRVLVVGEMTSLGFDGLYFFSTGSAIFCLVYFIYRKEWARRNDPLDEQTDKKIKVLTRTWNNKIDYHAVLICFMAGIL